MKVRTRIILGLGILFVAVSSALLLQSRFLSRLRDVSIDIKDNKLEAVDTIRGMVDELERLHRAAVIISSGSDLWGKKDYTENLDAQLKVMRQARERLQGRAEKLVPLVAAAPATGLEDVCHLREEFDRLNSAWASYSDAILQIEASYAKRTVTRSLRNAASLVTGNRDDLVNRIEAVSRGIDCVVDSTVVNSVNQADRAVGLSTVLVVVALGASLWAGIWIVHSVSGPLAALTRAHRRWMQEDFSHRVALEGRGRDEFTELAKSGNAMAERLGQLDELKQDFLSHVSHELKSPLNSIHSSARMLLRESSGPLTPRQRRRVQLMIENAQRLSGNIVNLLDYSKLEAGVFTYQFAEQDLVPLMHRFLEGVEPVAAEHGLRVEKRIPIGTPVRLRCDAERLLQVVGNLFDNALKFSSPGSAVGVGLEVREKAPHTGPGRSALPGPFVLISVIDCGAGVPEDQRESIFTKFHQVTGSRKGVGLGLAICRKIVEAHKGWIWCEANPQGGAIFRFQLPMASTESDPEFHAKPQSREESAE